MKQIIFCHERFYPIVQEWSLESLFVHRVCRMKYNPFFYFLYVFFFFFFQERNPAFYDRLYEALHLLVEFFSVNGNGLTESKLHTDSYTRMELLYGLNKVIIFFCSAIFVIGACRIVNLWNNTILIWRMWALNFLLWGLY